MRNLNNDELIYYAATTMVLIDGDYDNNEVKAVLDVVSAFTSSGFDGIDSDEISGWAIEDIKSMGAQGPAKVVKYNLAKADATTQRNICIALAKVALADDHVADEESIFFTDCLEIAGLTIYDLK